MRGNAVMKVKTLSRLKSPLHAALYLPTNESYKVVELKGGDSNCTVRLRSNSSEFDADFLDPNYKFYNSKNQLVEKPNYVSCLENSMIHTEGEVYEVLDLTSVDQKSEIFSPWRLIVSTTPVNCSQENVQDVLSIPFDAPHYKFIKSISNQEELLVN